MSTTVAVVTVIVAFLGICVAAGGYLVTVFANLRVAQHSAEVARVTEQLREFYGPLYVACVAGEAAYKAFVRRLRQIELPDAVPMSGREFLDGDRELTAAESKEWRLWFTSVFDPLNEVRLDLVLRKAYLIEDAEFPDCLTELVSYSTQSRAILARWKQGDYEENLPDIVFPPVLLSYARQGYDQLNRRLKELERQSLRDQVRPGFWRQKMKT